MFKFDHVNSLIKLFNIFLFIIYILITHKAEII